MILTRMLHLLSTLPYALVFLNSAPLAEAHANGPKVEPRLLVPRYEYYPVLSLRLGEVGRVLLEYKIDANGRPQNVSVILSESPRLEAAAIRVLESATIENGSKADLRGSTETWELAVLFELDSCGKLTTPDPKATLVKVCGKRSVPVSESGQVSKQTFDQLPDDATLGEAIRKAQGGDLDQQRWLCSQFAYWNRTVDPPSDKWCKAGAMYVLGRGVPEDREKGLAWLRRPAQR